MATLPLLGLMASWARAVMDTTVALTNIVEVLLIIMIGKILTFLVVNRSLTLRLLVTWDLMRVGRVTRKDTLVRFVGSSRPSLARNGMDG